MGFSVKIQKNGLHFAASHFITYEGKCEFLHGHNYGVSVELQGGLTADSYVFDFVALKKICREICETLDHRFLLATENPHLTMKLAEHEWLIEYKDNHYAFPEKDVKPLPVDNITAERLAEYISGELRKRLQPIETRHLTHMVIGVEEAEGQAAYFCTDF
jgi:6-pyruvoyl tetrahydropterin synthase/QueD family protein